MSLGVVGAVLAASTSAHAYTIETPATLGCHEALTADALRAVRARVPAIAVAAGDETALLADLPFTLPVDLHDLGGVTMLLAVRDSDLAGRSVTDLDQLALVHGDPSQQAAHCLRAPSDDEPTGSATALAACRSFIAEHALSAGDMLTADGLPDPTRREDLVVALDARGRVTLRLPAFHVRAARALHALQDGFGHSYRSPDHRRVRALLNWVDTVGGGFDPSRDGPSHAKALDECESSSPLVRARRAVALEASIALLRAIVEPKDRTSRAAAINVVLDEFFTVDSTCHAGNQWCNAPEVGLADPVSSCAFGRARLGPMVALLVALVLLRRRRALLALGLVTLTPGVAGAAEGTVETKSLAARTEERPRFGVQASVAGALDRTALAGSLAARFRLDPRWLVGLDVEWNPWASIPTGRIRPGALNVYGTLARRWPLVAERFDLRSTIHLGTSTALFDLYGVPAGSTGIYVGVNFLGLEWLVSRNVSIVIDPADVALPVPQLRGVPFGYLQYRFTVGVQYGG